MIGSSNTLYLSTKRNSTFDYFCQHVVHNAVRVLFVCCIQQFSPATGGCYRYEIVIGVKFSSFNLKLDPPL